jgi:hypothetical protein
MNKKLFIVLVLVSCNVLAMAAYKEDDLEALFG